jgi:AcrR family transcriptional regulator
MSYLRDIMQKLGAGAEAAVQEGRGGAAWPALQAAEYRRRLETCSEPMLHYEWAWLEQHLQNLELCASNDAMLKVAGGQRHLDGLVAEARQCQHHLRDQFAARGLSPRRLPHSLAAAEHAWELSHPGLRAQWGIDSEPAP